MPVHHFQDKIDIPKKKHNNALNSVKQKLRSNKIVWFKNHEENLSNDDLVISLQNSSILKPKTTILSKMKKSLGRRKLKRRFNYSESSVSSKSHQNGINPLYY